MDIFLHTQSRAFIYNVNHTLPIISIITDPDNLFDNDDGIYVFGDSYDQNYPHYGANFWEDRAPIFSLYQNNTNYEIGLMLELRYLEGGVEAKLKDLFQFLQEENMGPRKLIISSSLS